MNIPQLIVTIFFFIIVIWTILNILRPEKEAKP
jgi:hypothetical protein